MVSYEGDNIGKKMSEWKVKVARAFGFGYPHTVIVLHRGEDERYIENPEIVEEREQAFRREVLDEKEIKAQGTGKISREKAEKSKKHVILKNSLLKDPKTNDMFYLRGEVRKYLKPGRIVDYYPEAAMALLLPAFIIYTLLLMWMFGAVQMGTFSIMFITFLLAMLFFQGRYVYTEGNIRGIDAAYKGQISALGLYVPMSADFLHLLPQEDKDLENDAIRKLQADIKKYAAENQLLTEEVQKMADGYTKSFLLGLRMRKGYLTLEEKWPGWVFAAIGLIAGILIGIMLSGGVAPGPGASP
ncbi:MAG: hypothetical protein GXO25_04220 [Euryarchaeota archaeon]|nr:hypothetical protein [Euryarchaeota archaeon]